MDGFDATLLATTGKTAPQGRGGRADPGGERNFIILVKNPLNLPFAVI